MRRGGGIHTGVVILKEAVKTRAVDVDVSGIDDTETQCFIAGS